MVYAYVRACVHAWVRARTGARVAWRLSAQSPSPRASGGAVVRTHIQMHGRGGFIGASPTLQWQGGVRVP